MISAATLNTKSMKDLGKLAGRYGVSSWKSLNKEQLVKAIVRAAAAHPAKGKGGEKSGKPTPAKTGSAKTNPTKGGSSKAVASKGSTAKAKPSKSSLPDETKGKLAKSPAESPRAAAAKVSSAKASAEKSVTAARSTHPTIAAKGGTAKPVAKTNIKPAAEPKVVESPKQRAKSAKVQQQIQIAKAERERLKNLATPDINGHEVVVIADEKQGFSRNGNGEHEVKKSLAKKDRIVLLVRDAYWLQAVWELSRQSVERAQVALDQLWHDAKPVLRLIELESNSTTSAVEQVHRIVPIHGEVNTWFLHVEDSPKTFRVDIGYQTSTGKFFALARSNAVTTPRPGVRDGLENNWSDIADDCEKIYALSGGFSDETPTGELQEVFEERLGRPMSGPAGSRYGVGADKVFSRRSAFQFEVDAEMIIFGRTRPNARVKLAGNPIKLRADGSFAARLAMPDRRQVLPIVASSADGVEEHTVVIAVERNTKVMEPMLREAND